MVELKIKLPEHFLEEEVRDGYKVSAFMKEVWAVELDLLAEFMRVCDEHGITYYADAGTILGAVRHGGFIPWDDDIDVMMFRDQYDRLQEIAPTAFKHPYFFQTQYTDPGSLRSHAQLRNSMTTGISVGEWPYKLKFNQGIFMDIFPIDGVPEDDAALVDQCQTARQLLETAREKSKPRDRYVKDSPSPIRGAIKAFRHALYTGPLRSVDLYEHYYRDFEKTITKYNGEKTTRVAKYFTTMPTEKDRKRRLWPRRFFDTTDYLQFEMLRIPVPGAYRELLDVFYGDWKTPVVGTQTHNGLIFDTSRSYKEYICGAVQPTEEQLYGRKKV
ncbi:MAG: LicD family protein [Lachnospiraceae bacterium]|nr:LicD family protein [Lachnospiraceae bacterium]